MARSSSRSSATRASSRSRCPRSKPVVVPQLANAVRAAPTAASTAAASATSATATSSSVAGLRRSSPPVPGRNSLSMNVLQCSGARVAISTGESSAWHCSRRASPRQVGRSSSWRSATTASAPPRRSCSGVALPAGDADHQPHAGGARRLELARIDADEQRPVGRDVELLERVEDALLGRQAGDDDVEAIGDARPARAPPRRARPRPATRDLLALVAQPVDPGDRAAAARARRRSRGRPRPHRARRSPASKVSWSMRLRSTSSTVRTGRGRSGGGRRSLTCRS